MDKPSARLNPHLLSTACLGAALTAVCVLIYLANPSFIAITNSKIMDAVVVHSPAGATNAGVVVVEIDDQTLERFGQWPWPRYRLARLLDAVMRQNASGIALDIVMAEPDRTSLKAIKESIHEDYGLRLETGALPHAVWDNDAVMEKTLSRGSIVLGYDFLFDAPANQPRNCRLHPLRLLRIEKNTSGILEDDLPQAMDAVCNLDRFSEAVAYSGFLNGLVDPDGVLRRLPLVIRYDGGYYPSLALATLLQAEGRPALSYRKTADGLHQFEFGQKTIPVDRHGYLRVQFPAGPGTLPRVSALALLTESAPAIDLGNRLVFIGLSASGLSTLYPIPAGRRLSEVEIQAHLAEAILSERYIHRNIKVLYSEVMIAVLLGVLYSLCAVRLALAPAAGLGALGIFGAWQGAVFLFESQRVLFSPLLPIAVTILCAVFLSLFKYWVRQRRAHQSVRDAVILMKGSERRLNSIIQTIPDIVFRLDTEGRITFISPAITKYAQVADALIGKHILDIVAPGDRAIAKYRINERRTGQRATTDMEMRLLLAPPKTEDLQEGRYFSVSAEGIYTQEIPDKACFAGTQGIARDISRRKQLEHQLEQSKKMEAIGGLAAGVAHDLNNILSGLVSYPELLLLDLPPDSPLRKKILTIQQSGQRAAAIVQDMLMIARQGVSNPEILNLNQAVVDYLRSPEAHKVLSGRPDIRVEKNLATDILNVKGSRVHLLKVVMNLVSNAVEAMPSGGRIELATRNLYLDTAYQAYERIPEGEYVRLRVADEGIGIPEADLHRVFEPFFTKKRMGQSGSGLGMTVVWTTVKDHGGYVNLYSREGEGTRFDIYFPATRELPQEMNRRAVIEDYIGTEQILVVDDIQEQRDIAVQMLSKLGYSVASAPNGEKAVEYMQTHKADLLVLDMVMQPGIDGLETYKRICQVHPHQKAIIASGFSESERVKELQALGAGAYIRKPYTLEKIGMAVRHELDRMT